MASRHPFALIAALIAVVSLGLAVDTARRASACYDEPKHIATGAYALSTGRFLGDDNSPAVVLYGWAARAFEWQLPPPPAELTPSGKRLGLYQAGVTMLVENGVLASLFQARLASVLVFALILLLVALEGRALGGPVGMVVALALAGFSPVLLSHASIVSADLPLALAAVFLLRSLRRYVESPAALRAFVLGLACALALAAKLTGIVLVGGAALIAIVHLLRRSVPSEGSAPRRVAPVHALVAIAALLLGLLAVSGGDPAFYLRQWRLVSNYPEAAGSEFFRGTLGARSLAFYPLVLALKLEPAFWLALLILVPALVFAAVAAALRRRPPASASVAAAWYSIGLAVLLFAAMVAAGYRQGVRFLLPMWPLLAIAAAYPFRERVRFRDGESARTFGRPRIARGVAAAAVATLAGAVALAQHPDHLAYWNPLARGGGDAYFVDSNHDWGQDLTTLARWQRERPDVALYGALWSIVPPSAYGIEFGDVLGDPATLARPDPERPTLVAFSVTLLRALAAEPTHPLAPLAAAFLDARPDVEFGRSIRGYYVTPQRLTALADLREAIAGGDSLVVPDR